MSSKRVWFITGASRGMGVDFANAALAAGHAVVATARDSSRVSQALGQSDDLLAVKLDVTSRVEAEAAVRTAVEADARERLPARKPQSQPERPQRGHRQLHLDGALSRLDRVRDRPEAGRSLVHDDRAAGP